MKNKGFTLLELLGVLVILGIIGLTTVPGVLNVLERNDKSKFRNSVLTLVNEVQNKCDLQIMNLEELTKSYTFVNGIIDNELELSGDYPDFGYVNVSDDCKVELLVSDDKYCIKKEFDSEELKLKELKNGECPIE